MTASFGIWHDMLARHIAAPLAMTARGTATRIEDVDSYLVRIALTTDEALKSLRGAGEQGGPRPHDWPRVDR